MLTCGDTTIGVLKARCDLTSPPGSTLIANNAGGCLDHAFSRATDCASD